jgi:hypothetical protein
VVHARLAILGRVDRVALAEFDLSESVQLRDLPAYERVEIRVCIRCEEGAAPVDARAEGVVVGLLERAETQVVKQQSKADGDRQTHDGDGRKVFEPVVRVRKLLDLLAWDADGLEDLELVGVSCCLGRKFSLLSL